MNDPFNFNTLKIIEVIIICELKLFLDFLRFYRIKISPFKKILNKKKCFFIIIQISNKVLIFEDGISQKIEKANKAKKTE